MARKYDHEYKVQAVKLAKEIGGAKAAKELGIPEGTISFKVSFRNDLNNQKPGIFLSMKERRSVKANTGKFWLT